MAQVRALVRKLVLEELLAGEVLEIGVIDPALAHAFVGQTVSVLDQQKPDHEARLDPRPTLLAVEQRDFAVDEVPIDLAGELRQLVLDVDDLVQPGAKQIERSRGLMLLRPHRPLRCSHRITLSDSRESGKRNCKVPAPRTPNLAISYLPNRRKNDSTQRLRNCSRPTKLCGPSD